MLGSCGKLSFLTRMEEEEEGQEGERILMDEGEDGGSQDKK